MAMIAQVDASQAKLLDVEESESEQGSGQRRAEPGPAAEGGRRLRRMRAVGAASLALLLGSAGAWLGLAKRESGALPAPGPEASRGPLKLPPTGLSQRMPDMEQLFELARTVHPDFESRIAEVTAEHQIPNVYLNRSAQLLDGNVEKAFRNLKAKMEPQISTFRSLEIQSCFLDTWMLIIGLGSLIVNADACYETCDQPYPNDILKRNTCASMVTLQLAFWGYLGTYICNMWSSCPGVFSKNATCALGPIGIIASSFGLANAGATMAGNCKQGITTTPMPAEDTDAGRRAIRQRERRNRLFADQARGGGRRLHGDIVRDFLRKGSRPAEQVVEEEEEEDTALDRVINAAKDARQEITEHREEKEAKQWAIAACVFDSQNAVARILYAITFMGFAAIDCREEVFQQRGEIAKDKCVIDIGIIISSLAIAAQMIALDQINCPHQLEYMPDNLCANGILATIAASGYVAVAFAGIHDACKEVDPDGI